MKNSKATLQKTSKKRRHWKRTIDPDSVPKTILRRCKDCGEVRPCKWSTTFTQTGKPEYRARCRECSSKRLHQQRQTHRKILTGYSLDRGYRLKTNCVFLLGGECSHCGYQKSLNALTFHHIDPTTKIGAIGVMIHTRSWAAVLKELKKCVLLCFNCHMEEEERLEEIARSNRESA